MRRTLHFIAHISGFHEQLELILLTQAENMKVVDLSEESFNALLRPIDFVETIFWILLTLWKPLIDSNDLLGYRRLIRSCRRLGSVSWESRVPLREAISRCVMMIRSTSASDVPKVTIGRAISAKSHQSSY
jgi:hypothetical protein